MTYLAYHLVDVMNAEPCAPYCKDCEQCDHRSYCKQQNNDEHWEQCEFWSKSEIEKQLILESAQELQLMLDNNAHLHTHTPESLYDCSTMKFLFKDEVFVFGSNPQGVHNSGSALLAMQHYGAKMGQGVGLQGRSYAIPTTFDDPTQIKPHVDDFITFAREQTHLAFFVAPIGCGVAGFTPEQIAPLFADAVEVFNIVLPKRFLEVLQPQTQTLYRNVRK